jgi:hypothetical protein
MALSLARLSRKVETAARRTAARLKRNEKRLAALERKQQRAAERKLDREAKAFISKDNARRRGDQAHVRKLSRLEREAERREERERRRNEF